MCAWIGFGVAVGLANGLGVGVGVAVGLGVGFIVGFGVDAALTEKIRVCSDGILGFAVGDGGGVGVGRGVTGVVALVRSVGKLKRFHESSMGALSYMSNVDA